jgi:alpha-tubulin suppressor-like RCC1 family protein
VVRLVASFANSGALLADGRYFDWGYDGGGQLGDGRARRSSDVPIHVKLPRPVTQVAQGGSIWDNGQSLVLLADGSLWSWGSNQAYQLGTGTRRAQPAPVRFSAPDGVTYTRLATGRQRLFLGRQPCRPGRDRADPDRPGAGGSGLRRGIDLGYC